MKIPLVSLFVLLNSAIFAQKDWDSIIVIQTKDTANLYKRVKHAFINMDFIVKDLESDTLKTYPREFMTNGYIIANAIINRDNVTLKGIWGARKLNYFGSSVAPREYKNVYFYKGSVEWKLLMLVAEAIGGELSFKQ